MNLSMWYKIMLYQTIKEILILTNIINWDHKEFIELFHTGSGSDSSLGSRFESSSIGLKIGLPVTTAIIFIIIIAIAVLVIAVLIKRKSKKENLKSG